MYELVYCSTAKANLSREEIEDILRHAQRHNAANNITGCLLFHNNEFLQILEGEEKMVRELFLKIDIDERHNNVLLLDEGGKQERIFPRWSMAFHELSDENVHDLEASIFKDNFLSFSQLAAKPTFPMKLFWTKARQLLSD